MQFKRILYTSFIMCVLLLPVVITTYAQASSKKLVSPLPLQSAAAKKIFNAIIYVSNVNGNYDIYRMDIRTKKPINLTENLGADMNPQLSPDGRRMTFYSDRDGDTEIYVMDLLLRTVTQLTDNNTGDYDPSFSPDGNQIVFKSTRDDKLGDIFIMNADGTDQRNLTPSRTFSEEWNPKFTPDGKKIIFVVREKNSAMLDELYSMQQDGTSVERLTDNVVPDWYPDPKNTLLYISKTDQKNPDDIYKSNLDGTNTLQLTSQPGNDADPAWNPTGDQIIFINDQDGDYDLYTMDADGSKIKKIYDTKGDELSPIYLP